MENRKVPFWNCLRFAQVSFSEMDLDSSSAKDENSVNKNSDSIVPVLIPSFSNRMFTPRAVKVLTISRQSVVLRANREMDFVRIKSTRPALQSEMRR